MLTEFKITVRQKSWKRSLILKRETRVHIFFLDCSTIFNNSENDDIFIERASRPRSTLKPLVTKTTFTSLRTQLTYTRNELLSEGKTYFEGNEISDMIWVWHGLMLLWFKDLMNVTEKLQFIDPTFRHFCLAPSQGWSNRCNKRSFICSIISCPLWCPLFWRGVNRSQVVGRHHHDLKERGRSGYARLPKKKELVVTSIIGENFRIISPTAFWCALNVYTYTRILCNILVIAVISRSLVTKLQFGTRLKEY